MLEQYLIDHCSPTLASLKTANLFYYKLSDRREFLNSVARINRDMHKKGVTVVVLRLEEKSALVYVARLSKLQRDLNAEGVAEFLKGCGYSSTDCGEALKRLRERIACGAKFPHEIGLFLGYPLGDVKGFIENAGAHSKCTGCWKVYCNECEAIKTFAKFKKCKSIYSKLYQSGASLFKLTVAA